MAEIEGAGIGAPRVPRPKTLSRRKSQVSQPRARSSRQPTVPQIKQPATPKAPPPPQQVSAQKFSAIYPSLEPSVVQELEARGLSFVVNPSLARAGQYNPLSRMLSILPGQPVETAAHELVHATQHLAPGILGTNALAPEQALQYSLQSGRAYLPTEFLRTLGEELKFPLANSQAERFAFAAGENQAYQGVGAGFTAPLYRTGRNRERSRQVYSSRLQALAGFYATRSARR